MGKASGNGEGIHEDKKEGYREQTMMDDGTRITSMDTMRSAQIMESLRDHGRREDGRTNSCSAPITHP
jgi:hypothetical protein